MKPLLPLSPAARQLLELGCPVQPPTAEQGARMARVLAPLLEAGAGGALSGALPPAPGSSAQSLLLGAGGGKLLLALSALAATSGAFWLGRISRLPEPPPPAAIALPATPAMPEPVRSELVHAEPVLAEPVQAPSSAVSDGSSRGPPRAEPAPTPQAGGLGADIQRLARADAALRRGQVSEALRLLDAPVVRELREQAAALRAVAGCHTGTAPETGRARAMLEHWPGSAYEARVRGACGL